MTETEVPLRDYVQIQINALEKKLCARFVALEQRLKEQHESDEKALLLKATDMQKDTDDIRHDIRRLIDVQQTKLGKEEWNEYHTRQLKLDFISRTEFMAYRESITQERATALGIVQGKAKVTAVLYTSIGTSIAIMSVIIAFVFHR